MHKPAKIDSIPALWFALTNSTGLIMAALRGCRTAMELYGFPPQLSSNPETWPVWRAVRGRSFLLGLLMHYFLWRGQYAECDVLLMGAAFLEVNDYLVLGGHRNPLWAWSRVIFYASAGYFGWTQGRVWPAPRRLL